MGNFFGSSKIDDFVEHKTILLVHFDIVKNRKGLFSGLDVGIDHLKWVFFFFLN